ncbi:hypothetical protein PG999_010302 [Apiospora kogelbergensis]|uniref:Uncharacterized protein n=1 Tax=Apiospora kogelbergensis TaxID=1337665 RepID=A0AAW0QR41_9PEZI
MRFAALIALAVATATASPLEPTGVPTPVELIDPIKGPAPTKEPKPSEKDLEDQRYYCYEDCFAPASSQKPGFDPESCCTECHDLIKSTLGASYPCNADCFAEGHTYRYCFDACPDEPFVKWGSSGGPAVLLEKGTESLQGGVVVGM